MEYTYHADAVVEISKQSALDAINSIISNAPAKELCLLDAKQLEAMARVVRIRLEGLARVTNTSK